MRRRFSACLGLVAVLTVAGCGRAPERAAGDISPSEQQALNDAAAMLDANSVDAAAVGGSDNGQ